MWYRFPFSVGVFLLLSFISMHGQEKTVFVSQLTEEHGLSPGSVMNFFQDAEGYLWICTIAGLNRYDGNQITTYISDPIDLNSLSATPVHDITQDRTGKMWIATRGGGLNSYDLQTEKFTHYRHDPGSKSSIASDDLTYIDIDDQGRLWIGSQTALTQFDPATGRVEQFHPAPGEAGRLQGNCRGEIIADSLRIYLGTSAGFEYFDRRTGSFRYFPLIDPESGDTLRYQVYGMVRDRLGKVWFGRPGDGLRVYDPATDTVTLYELYTPAGRRNGRPMLMLEDQNGFLWIVCYTDIWRISPDRAHIERFDVRAIDTNELLSVGLWSIFEDRSGLIWFGGRPRRALFFDPRREVFQFYGPAEAKRPGRAFPAVYCLEQDRQGFVWYGDEHKLYRYDPKTGRKAEYPQISFINDLTIGPRGLIWLATELGLFRFDPATGRSVPVLTEEKLGAFIANTGHLVFDQEGDLWVTVGSYGLCCIAREVLYGKTVDLSGGLQVWRTSLDDPKAIPVQDLHNVVADAKGNIWVCGNLGGITRIEKASGEFKTFSYQQGLAGAISNNYTFSVVEGPGGYIWISTNGGGLNRYSPETENFVHYTIGDGLPSNVVFDLVFDREGFLWLNTPKGLSCFDPAKEIFTNFDEKDELQCWESDVHYSTYTNIIFTTGEKGFDVFSPFELLNLKKTPSPVSLVSVAHFDSEKQQMVRLKRSAWSDGRLELSHREGALRMQFAVLDFRNPARHRYRYSLAKGAEPTWVDLQSQNQVDFARLEPGRYFFQWEGQNSDGLWSRASMPLTIVIRPPFWLTGWAYALYWLLAGSIVFFLYRFNMKRQLAIREARQARELNDLKTSLYTNITHEFRTPLTVIMGMADNIMEHQHERTLILRNSENLLRLVNQLLDLSKLDSGVMKIDKVQGDIIHYLRYLTESFHSMAAEKNIRLDFESVEPELIMDFDEVKIQHIVYNLLSNALKFTPNNGKVTIQVDLVRKDGRSCLQLSVSDTGIGIPEDQLSHIFNRFYQVDGSPNSHRENQGGAAHIRLRSEGGTGIGLALTKELVVLMEGDISVKSRLGAGTTFTFHIPVARDPNTPKMKKEPTLSRQDVTDLTVDPAPSASPPAPLASESPDAPILLIIEDNADVTTYIESILKSEYRIAKAANGRAGIDQAFELIPDIIITDVMMPEKNGYEVCATLKLDERTSHIPIVMLTAKATDADRIAGLETGADAYLLKPFNKEELFIRLEKLIELRRALQARYARAVEPLDSIPAPGKEEIKSPTLDDLFLKKIREVIQQKMGDADLGVDHLAEAAYLSRTQVYRKMKALTGESPTVFIRKMRLYQARQLLRTTDLNISEIAYELGFTDPNYFSRVFSKEFGAPPSAVRE